MTTKLSEAPDAPLFFPHELNPDGTPTIAGMRRAFPVETENDTRTDEHMLSLIRWLGLFDRTFSAYFRNSYEASLEARAKKRLGNHRKYVQRKAKLKEGAK